MFSYFSTPAPPVDRATLQKEVINNLGPLDSAGEKFVDENCVERYLRANRDDPRKAAHMLSETLHWRKESGAGAFMIDQFPIDAESGKFYIGGQTDDGTPVLVNRKKADKITLEEAESYVNFLCLTLDTAIKIMPSDIEKWVWILDLNGYSRSNSPPFSVTLQVLRILANHYPERMAKCYIVDAPKIFSLLYTAVYPFIDPVTKEKLNFVKSDEFDTEGKRLDGATDKSGFGAYMRFFKTPFNAEKFKAFF